MGVVSRGIKNAFRNGIRSTAVILILSISIAMSLVMLISLKTVQAKISSVKSSIGNTISVSPAGMRGFEGGGTLLTSQNASDIKSLAHVTAVIETLSGRLTTIGSSTSNSPFGRDTNSNAQTSLSAPPVQASSNSNSSRGRFVANGQQITGGSSFSMPITVTGVNDLSNNSALQASSFSVTSGDKIDPTSSDKIAMIGKDLADQNKISAGQTFTAYGQTISVKGIFDAGNTFANNRIIMPIAAVQSLSGQSDQIDSLIVTTDSIDSLSLVQSAIKDKLGTNVDVTSSEQSAQTAVAPLENIKTISLYSLIGSLIAGAVILFMTMVMIVRERRREIGVLKAIGSSNLAVTMQFVVESLVLTITSSVIGIIAGVFMSNPILKVLVSDNSSSATNSAQNFAGGGGGRAMMRLGAGVLNGAQGNLRNLTATVSPSIILYGLLAAVLIAVLGSIIPSFVISKISPAEVMRAE